jgi:uncharacterized protein (TIGR02001 family)
VTLNSKGKSNYMKKFILAILAAVSVTAYADNLSGSAGFGTDYRFRGISQTQDGASVQASVTYTSNYGVYVSGAARSVSAQEYANSSGAEVDGVIGFKKELFNGLTLDVGSANYFYPGATTDNTDKNFTTNELFAGLGYGPVSVKYNRSMGDYFGIANSNGTQYFQADVKYPVPGFEKVNLLAHAGRTYVGQNQDNLNYADYNLGASYNFYKSWTASARWYKNGSFGSEVKTADTVDGQKLYKQTVGLVVSTSF